MSNIKMNTLLAITDSLASSYKKGLSEYIKFFKDKQSAFRGEKKTYIPKDNTIDLPSERSNVTVVTTVDEKLEYLVKTSKDYVDALFSQEKTNASGLKQVELLVGDIKFGTFTALELLRLKSLLESGDLEGVYANIPVRPDNENWTVSSNEQYVDRKIYESDKSGGTRKSTEKEQYILTDPNIGRSASTTYTPQIGTRTTIVELGDFTFQKFSGEISHRNRAEILLRRSKLLTAVVAALKDVNDVIAVQSEMTAEKLFGYLHTGEIV